MDLDIFVFSMNATLPVVLCMALGVFLRHRGRLEDTALQTMSKLCFQVFLPCLTFSNISGIDFSAEFSPRFVGFALACIVLLPVVLSAIFAPILRDWEWVAAAVHVGFRSNYTMFGILMTVNMFGDAGAKTAAMLIPVAVIVFNVITLILFGIAGSGKSNSPGKVIQKTLLNLAKNPLIIASALGLAAALSPFALPAWVGATAKSLGGVASPLCLILLGAQITLKNLSADSLRVWMLTATRLIFVPVALVGVSVAAGFRGPELGALFVLFASPCANSSMIMAQQYNIKPVFTAQVVAMTTVFSGITTFLGISCLRWLQLF